MQIPLARQREPERNHEYGTAFVARWDQYTIRVREVLEWARERLGEKEALQLADLVHASWDAARKAVQTADREVRWWQWMTACWYLHATGRHLEEPPEAAGHRVLPKVGNIIDARELIERLRAQNHQRRR